MLHRRFMTGFRVFQRSEYATVQHMPLVKHMPKFSIYQGSECAEVRQCSELV